MNKNNKRKSAVAAMALTLLVGAGSLAYFTDVKTGNMEAKAGNVTIAGEGETEITVDKLMVPGDKVSLADVLEGYTYGGNVGAMYRVKAVVPEDCENCLPYSHVVDNEAIILKEQGWFITDSTGTYRYTPQFEADPNSNMNYLTNSADIEPGDTFDGMKDRFLTIHEETGNEDQDKPIKFKIVLEVIQRDNVTVIEGNLWGDGSEEIKVVPAK